MKNRVILSIVIIIVGIAGVAAFAYFSSFHKVAITFSSDVSSVIVYKEGGDQIDSLSAARDISLQNGNYYIVPDGEKVSKDKVRFTVQDTDITLEVDPDYSTAYLNNLLESEQSQINKAATEAFPTIATEYTIEDSTLYGHGEWFGALLIKNVTDERDIRDFYRILLHKEGGEWKVVNKPELVLTKAEFKNVPVDVITAINELAE